MLRFSETVCTLTVKGDYTARRVSYYRTDVAIFYKGKHITTVKTRQDARQFLDAVKG